jgi:uroporphyrinogen-III decarboxylase
VQAWYLRGFNKFSVDLNRRSKIADRILDGLLRFFLESGKRLAELGVDILCIGDDIAMQTGMMISPTLWRKYFKTRLAEIIRAVKGRGSRVAFHTDGNCEAIIPDLVEIGVDILDPIQPECMNPLRIKQLYGDKLTLCGTISLQSNLAFGSVDSVKEEVRERIRTLAPHGGFVVSPSNQATVDIAVDNFLAVYSSAREFGSYTIA